MYPTDQRLLSRLDSVCKRMRECLDVYEFGLAKIAFEEFFWTDFCDNYLEMVKVRLYKPELFVDGENKKKSAQTTLYIAFYTIVRLLASYIPHITECIYQEYFKQYVGLSSIHVASFPSSGRADTPDVSIDSLFAVVSQVRGYKTQRQLSLGSELSKITIS